MTDTTKSLILENYFPNDPNIDDACVINSASLAEAISVCHTAAGNRWSNFLAVDFYKVPIPSCNLGVFMFTKFMDDICTLDRIVIQHEFS